ncbi:DUF2487 family protein [Paenibacillus aestuarii]|uniref:DUF2487 family protein n=1 Tax=Paenibacillus aestuarii TaxID=516965 RepID=A0ABW0K414_9BACL|nr:DUF2487 family protein [Paenibacillus aestuarii]
MKFSEIEQDQWPDLKPYLDTCLLPLTGLKGFEDPVQTTHALEQLRDALDVIEIPYKGRVVTYPALHYVTGVDMPAQLDAICLQLKRSGFRYVIVMTIHLPAAAWTAKEADLLISVDMAQWPEQANDIKSRISQQIQQMWQQGD